jgi:hypothetical protein
MAVLSESVQAKENAFTLAELRKVRKEMTHRKRRIIFNNDGDDFEGHGGKNNNRTKESAAMTATPEGLLKLRTTALLDSQVDTIFYSSVYGLRLMYRDSAFKRIYEFPDRKPKRREVGIRNYQALITNYGMDNLEVMIDCARKNDLEIFFSNRMNDNHDWYFPGFLSAIKVRHPEYTIGHADANATGTQSPEETLRLMLQGKQGETALNFGLPVIRDLTVAAMQEICRNYDIDGIDLDYFRFFKLFPDPVGPEQIELLTDMMRKMRVMTEEEGLRRGRPILISARAINSLDRCLNWGIDFETWLEEDLIDIIMPIHVSKQLGSLEGFYELARKYDVPIYPCVRYDAAYQHSWEKCRGEAMTRFAEGADGITTFNKFDPTHQMWWELGDPQALGNLDKTYTCPQYLPVTVTENASKPMRLLVAEDLNSTPPEGKRRSIALRIHATGLLRPRDLQVELNGQRIEPITKWNASPTPIKSGQAPPEGLATWIEFTPAAALFTESENLLTASVQPQNGPVTIDDIELRVVLVNTEVIQLAAGGKTNYQIVVADTPAVQVQAAADELAEFLRQVTGASFPVVKASRAAGKPQILVGPSQAVDGLDLPVDWAGLGPEGFVIQTAAKNLVIAGGPRRGTINGVYTFLEDVIGCRWYTPKFSVIPHKEMLSIDPLDIRTVPPFESRQTWRFMAPHGDANADWLARQRLNLLHPAPKWYPLIDSNPKLAGCMTYISSFGHTLGHNKLLPYAEFDQHPEYFALVNGERRKTGQPCMTNPYAMRLIVRNARRWLNEDPQGDILSISQPDGDFELTACQCPKCSAAFEKYGHTGALMRFVNQVTQACLTNSPLQGELNPDLFYVRQNGQPDSGGTYDLFRSDPTTLAEPFRNLSANGTGDGVLRTALTSGGNLVVMRNHDEHFDLFRYDRSTLSPLNSGLNLAGVDDGILDMVATADGRIVVLRQVANQLDLLRYNVAPDPAKPYHPNIGVESTGNGLAGIDDGILEMVATTGGHVVLLRQNGTTFDLLRYETAPHSDTPGDPHIREVNRLVSAVGLDDGVLAMVATADDHVVVARQYQGTLDLLHFDTAPDENHPDYPHITEVNRLTSGTKVEDGFLGMVGTATGDVVIAHRRAGVAHITRYDVTPAATHPGHPNVAKLESNHDAMPLEGGFLGMTALGNGNLVLARNHDGVIQIFVYDAVSLTRITNFSTDVHLGANDRLVGLSGFLGKMTDPAAKNGPEDIAVDLQQDRSDILIDTFAYHWTRKPPQGVTMHNNVVVRYSPGGAICTHHGFDACSYNRSVAAYEDLLEWTRISPRVWVWYYAHGGDKMHPLPHFSSLSHNFKLMRTAGVQGIFVQTDFGSERIEAGGLLELQSYLLAKLMWNPDYDVEAGIEEFCQACYGAAAPQVIAFVKMVNDADTYTGTPRQHYTENEIQQFPGFHAPGGAMVAIKQAKLAEMDRLFEQAETAVAGDPDSLERVRLARLAAQYVILLYAAKEDPLREKAIRDFFPLAARQGITKLRLPVSRREVSIDAFRKSHLGLESDQPQ